MSTETASSTVWNNRRSRALTELQVLKASNFVPMTAESGLNAIKTIGHIADVNKGVLPLIRVMLNDSALKRC